MTKCNPLVANPSFKVTVCFTFPWKKITWKVHWLFHLISMWKSFPYSHNVTIQPHRHTNWNTITLFLQATIYARGVLKLARDLFQRSSCGRGKNAQFKWTPGKTKQYEHLKTKAQKCYNVNELLLLENNLSQKRFGGVTSLLCLPPSPLCQTLSGFWLTVAPYICIHILHNILQSLSLSIISSFIRHLWKVIKRNQQPLNFISK